MVGDRCPPVLGGVRAAAGHGQVADLLLGPGVGFQQTGQPQPGMSEHPAGVTAPPGHVIQRCAQAPDSPVIGHDLFEYVGWLPTWRDYGT